VSAGAVQEHVRLLLLRVPAGIRRQTGHHDLLR